jgi:hypothetical protein
LPHGPGEEPARCEPVQPGQHGAPAPNGFRVNARGERSGGQTVATLTTARRQDGAAGAGTHPQTETVRLVTAAVVRLERTLAHGLSPVSGVERDIDLEPGLTAGAVRASSAGTARPRPPRRPPCEEERRGSVDMRHRSTPVRPPNGTRDRGTGSNRVHRPTPGNRSHSPS